MSRPENDFSYVLPGPVDAWGGTGPTSELLKGGSLILELGDQPSYSWGIAPVD